MATKSFIKTIGQKGLLADYNTEGKKLQTELTFDTTPTAGSSNPVTSDGIKTAISNSIDQTYSSTSTKAQSGVAVNEAFKTRETSTSDDSYTYLGMGKTYKGTEELYWKLVSFNTVYNYWTLQFEVDVSNGRKSDGSYDANIYETKRLTICGRTPGSVEYALEMRYTVRGLESGRGYGNNIYYEISDSNLVTVYIKAADRANLTQLCRLSSVINLKDISNVTWYEPVVDAGPQPTNPIKFKEVFPAIASTSSNIGSDSVPVYVNRGIPVSCNSANLKAGKDDDGNVIKNTYQKKLTFDTTPTAGSKNPVTSDGIRTMQPLSHRFDNETSSRLIIWGKMDGEGYIHDIVRKFGLQYGPMTDFLFANSVHKDNTTSVSINILNASSRPTTSTKRLKASIFKDSSENSYFALWLDGSISQPGAALYADYYPDVSEEESFVRHFTVFNPSEYTLVRDLTIKYRPLALPVPSAGVLTSNGSSNSWLTPPASGNAVLKSVNGVIQWVTE